MRFVQFVYFIIAFNMSSWPCSAYQDKHVEFLNDNHHKSSNLPFSQAVRVGELVFLSGEIGVDKTTGKLVTGGIRAEAKQTMNNIKSTLAAHGMSMGYLVKCTVMLADISEWQAFNEVYISYFEQPYPARSAFGANGLALGAKVEVECIASSA
ncbi:RidA family protein [Thalassotalea fusca]